MQQQQFQQQQQGQQQNLGGVGGQTYLVEDATGAVEVPPHGGPNPLVLIQPARLLGSRMQLRILRVGYREACTWEAPPWA